MRFTIHSTTSNTPFDVTLDFAQYKFAQDRFTIVFVKGGQAKPEHGNATSFNWWLFTSVGVSCKSDIGRFIRVAAETAVIVFRFDIDN